MWHLAPDDLQIGGEDIGKGGVIAAFQCMVQYIDDLKLVEFLYYDPNGTPVFCKRRNSVP